MYLNLNCPSNKIWSDGCWTASLIRILKCTKTDEIQLIKEGDKRTPIEKINEGRKGWMFFVFAKSNPGRENVSVHFISYRINLDINRTVPIQTQNLSNCRENKN